jgi:hypothetical protein
LFRSFRSKDCGEARGTFWRHQANIDARFVYKHEWADHENFGAKTVGYVVEDSESTTIFVNRNFYLLE